MSAFSLRKPEFDLMPCLFTLLFVRSLECGRTASPRDQLGSPGGVSGNQRPGELASQRQEWTFSEAGKGSPWLLFVLRLFFGAGWRIQGEIMAQGRLRHPFVLVYFKPLEEALLLFPLLSVLQSWRVFLWDCQREDGASE